MWVIPSFQTSQILFEKKKIQKQIILDCWNIYVSFIFFHKLFFKYFFQTTFLLLSYFLWFFLFLKKRFDFWNIFQFLFLFFKNNLLFFGVFFCKFLHSFKHQLSSSKILWKLKFTLVLDLQNIIWVSSIHSIMNSSLKKCSISEIFLKLFLTVVMFLGIFT